MTILREHTSTQFDIELEAVTSSILHMGELVQQQFQIAMEYLNDGETALSARVLDLGCQVNSLEVDIDRKCHLLLAQRQPEANDLRTILTALKCTTDIERIGDQAELIVRRAEMLFKRNELSLVRPCELARSASMVSGMLHNALQAFAHPDMEIATQVIRLDTQVNEEYSHITRNLIEHMTENPQTISTGLDILFMAKAIERIGDHAKNIAEYVIFMVQGSDVRHTPVETLPGQKNP